MPVRQIQFPSFRPSLPQQSRLIGLQPMPSAHRREVPCGVTHMVTPNTHQQELPQQPLQQLQSQLWQRSDAEPIAHGAAVASGADTSQPLAIPCAEDQGTHPINLPQVVAGSETVLPSVGLDQRPLVAALAVASTAALPHPQQLRQQLPQQPPQQPPQQLPQQLPYQVAPMPHITWPQPVVRWPHQAAATEQPQATKWLGEGVHSQARVSAPSHLASGHLAGSAPLQGVTCDPDRKQGAPLPPAGLALMQGGARAPADSLQPSLPPAGPAPLQGRALGPNRHPEGPAPDHGGSHAHTLPSPGPFPLVGSAPLQGLSLSPIRPSMAPPLSAEAAPFQGGISAALEPSFPLAGSAPLRGGTLAAGKGSVPAGVAARSSGRPREGVQSDAGASAHGRAMPPNKR